MFSKLLRDFSGYRKSASLLSSAELSEGLRAIEESPSVNLAQPKGELFDPLMRQRMIDHLLGVMARPARERIDPKEITDEELSRSLDVMLKKRMPFPKEGIRLEVSRELNAEEKGLLSAQGTERQEIVRRVLAFTGRIRGLDLPVRVRQAVEFHRNREGKHVVTANVIIHWPE